MAAGHYKLDTLCAIVDKNGLQIDGPVAEVMGVDPLADKYRAFGWNVVPVDGHDIGAVEGAFTVARATKGKPTVIIANTVKGKGVSFMENQVGWHGVATTRAEQLQQALMEIACPDMPPDRVERLLVMSAEFQKGADERCAAELPSVGGVEPRPRGDFWWNAGADMKVEMTPTRFGFGACLAKKGDDPRIVTVHADISASIQIAEFEKNHPERRSRVVSVGIAEQNMMSVAAGLALEGRIPVVGTYGVFAAGRPWDQIRTTICYDRLNVKIAGAHGGISVGADGATHQALEELFLMCGLPNMRVIAPCDAVETERLCGVGILEVSGPVYMRFAREATPVVTTEQTPLRFGTANVIRYRGRSASFKDAFQTVLAPDYRDEREDLTIAACGPMVPEAMRAAFILKETEGLETRVLNLHTVKPLDRDALGRAAAETGAVLTAEEHQKGGFGNLVAAAVAASRGPREVLVFDFLGVEDRFGESGKPWELMIHFGLTAEHIAARAVELMERKRGAAYP